MAQIKHTYLDPEQRFLVYSSQTEYNKGIIHIEDKSLQLLRNGPQVLCGQELFDIHDLNMASIHQITQPTCQECLKAYLSITGDTKNPKQTKILNKPLDLPSKPIKPEHIDINAILLDLTQAIDNGDIEKPIEILTHLQLHNPFEQGSYQARTYNNWALTTYELLVQRTQIHPDSILAQNTKP